MDDVLSDDAINTALGSRHIPHGRLRNKRGKPGKAGYEASHFDPLRARGRYEISLGSSARSKQESGSWMEIHELTGDGNGLVGTLSIGGKLQGMCVLCGSRKGLANIIQSLDSPDKDEDESEPDDGAAKTDAELDEDDLGDGNQQLNTPRSGFEKNSFRAPKFWMTWRDISVSDSDSMVESDPKRSAYLVFSSNDCEKLEGTISSDKFGWNNLKIRGWKVHSKASPCSLKWSDLS